MNIQIIADSCCDATVEWKAEMDLSLVPLVITVDGKDYVDDEELDVGKLISVMKATKKPVKTAAPSPEAYAQEMRKADASVVVTLSSKLSGSYNAAVAARDMVLEESPEKRIAVFDSKSASAGEVLLVLKLHELISGGVSFEELKRDFPAFIDGMRTYFVLEDLTTLIRNGRIPFMLGMLATILLFRPIMGENGQGEIVQVEKVRGTPKALGRLVEIVAEKTKHLKEKSLTLCLSHCNAPQRAQELKQALLKACPAIGQLTVQATRGLSTCYANDGGIIIAFA